MMSLQLYIMKYFTDLSRFVMFFVLVGVDISGPHTAKRDSAYEETEQNLNPVVFFLLLTVLVTTDYITLMLKQ